MHQMQGPLRLFRLVTTRLVPHQSSCILFPVLDTSRLTDLVSRPLAALSSVFASYNGNANWRGMDGATTRPVRASAHSNSTNCANGILPRPVPWIGTRFTS
jgi:hypothetical protein